MSKVSKISKYGEILTLIMLCLLIEKKLDPGPFCISNSITRRRLCDYISTIRNALYENHIYYISIEYKRSENLYICYINS